MMLDYKMTSPFTLQLQNRKNCLHSGQCLIILGKWQREAYLSFTLDLLCGSYFETQQAVWKSEIIEYDVIVALSVDLCMMSLLSALKHGTLLLNDFVCCQINVKHVFHSSATKPHLIGGYSVAPRWTWAQPQSARCSSYFPWTVRSHEKFTLIKWYADMGSLCHVKRLLGCSFQLWCYAINNSTFPRLLLHKVMMKLH